MAGPGAFKQGGILSLAIKDKSSLYTAYMPFIRNGGLFIPTNKKYKLAGKIVWITPTGSQGNRLAGIGVQFSEQDNGQIRNKIEGYLAGALKSDRQTHTL